MLHCENAIQAKKDSLMKKKPGSVFPNEPKIIWPKMIERVGGEYERALTVRYRYNAAMEDQLAKSKLHYILMSERSSQARITLLRSITRTQNRIELWFILKVP